MITIKNVLDVARVLYPSNSPRTVKNKFVFLWKAILHRKTLNDFHERMVALSRYHSIALCANTIGLLEWPYINNLWSVQERFDAVATHYEILESTVCFLQDININTSDSLLLLDLSFIDEGKKVAIDRSPWFTREGQLVLNLFDGELRIASIAFSFGLEKGDIIIIIGAIQGIHSGIPSDQSLSIIKNTTKIFEGLRPNSLLIEILRMISSILKIKKIIAVSDENRHHRHSYFGKRDQLKFSSNYNQIWIEHGGSKQNTPRGFYDIPIAPLRKTMAEIPTRKRAMYRRRENLLLNLEHRLEKRSNQCNICI